MKYVHACASAAIAVSLFATGCNSKVLRPPVTIYADAGGHGVAVTVRDRDHRFNSTMLSFLPSNVPLHAGDAVNFEVRDTGEPHTVALGRLVDEAVEAVEALGGTASVKTIEALPEMQRLPLVFPAVSGGSPRVNRSSVDRCFLETGSPPVSPSGGAPACTEREQPEFDGEQAFYSGGFLEEGEPFRVKLSPDIRAGTYAFMCLVHRASMVGAIEVRPAGVERPRVADVRKLGMDEENEVASTLEPAARRAAARRAAAGSVLAGTGPVGRSRGLISSFIPESTTIPTGESVTWRLYGTHSISFDASRDAQEGVLIEDSDGVHINLAAWRSVESAAPPAAAVSYPPTNAVVDIDGGTWSGEGSFSSGVLRGTPPGVVIYTLTFSKAGTYRYQCLVHQRMRGRVVVE